MKSLINNKYFYYFLLFFFSILICFETFNYGFIYDDRLLITGFLDVPLGYKFEAMKKYAKFHFYPVYFITHTFDQILTSIFFTIENYLDEKRIIIPRISNYFFHLINSFILFNLLKKIFNTKDNFIIFIAVALFLMHPVISQPLFNVTTRNELLYLFFSLLAFLKSFDFMENKNWKNCLKLNLYFFGALCSKLFAVTYMLLIPSFFLLKYIFENNFKSNIEKLLILCISLFFTFWFYYFLRYLNTDQYTLLISKDFVFNFFSSLHFYVRAIFFPYKHFYTNVFFTNTNFNIGVVIFLFLFALFCISIIRFYKKKDFLFLFYFFWLGSSLAIPIYFGLLTPESFPLTSEINERYAYGSAATISFLSILILEKLKYFKKLKFYNVKIIFCFFIICFSFALKDRSKVYKNDYIFWSTASYEHDEHLFNHIIPALLAKSQGEFKKSIFHLYQNYSLYPESVQNVLILYNVYLQMGENENAKNAYFKLYLEKFGQHPVILVLRTDDLIKEQKFNEAIPLLLNVLKYYEKDIWDNAVQVHGQDLTIRPFSKDDIFFKLGVCYANLGKKKKAFVYFNKAFKHNYNHTTAKYNAAIIAKEFGQKDLAFKLLKEAADQNPSFRNLIENKIKN